MLLPLQGALSIDSYTQGVALGYVLMPLRGVSTHLTEEPKIRGSGSFPSTLLLAERCRVLRSHRASCRGARMT